MSSFVTAIKAQGRSSTEPQPFNPHFYQRAAIKLMIEQGAAGLLLDPGLGKTSCTLAAFSVLHEQKLVRRMLVVAPLKVCQLTWPKELRKWEDFKNLKMTFISGTPAQRTKKMQEDSDIFLINPEGLKWLADQVWDFPEMLVVDESTKFKHTNTQRFKVLRKLLPRFKRRYILTGTPAPNGLTDLFGQVYILDTGHSLGRYITHFRNKYCVLGYDGFSWNIRPGADQEIYDAIRHLVMRLDAEDYLKLPEKITTTIPVRLPTEAMAKYRELEQEMVLGLQQGKVVASNAGVLVGKCRQIANGACYSTKDYSDSSVADWEKVHTAKIEAVVDLVEQLQGQPTMISYEFRHDLERLLEVLGKDTPFIGGGMKRGRLEKIEEDWNNGEIPILLVHPVTAAHGLNLQHGGRALIWFTLPWNLEHYDQLVRRLWRQGQKETVFIYHLMSVGTVDEVVLTTLMGKNHSQKALLNALKEEYLTPSEAEA